MAGIYNEAFRWSYDSARSSTQRGGISMRRPGTPIAPGGLAGTHSPARAGFLVRPGRAGRPPSEVATRIPNIRRVRAAVQAQ